MAARLFLSLSLLCLAAQAAARQRVLLYTYAQGYQHASRYDAAEALEKLGDEHSFSTVHLDEPTQLEENGWLDQFDALVFISTSGHALTPQGARNMRRYIEAGGGWMGIHEASDTAYEYPWYGRLCGAYFGGHPFIQHAEFEVAPDHAEHPSVTAVPKHWDVFGEVYHFSSDPRALNHEVVLTVDPSSYISNDATRKELNAIQGAPHPIAWYKEGNLLTAPKGSVGGGVDDKPDTKRSQRGTGGDGRSFYTALGHTSASFRDADMLNHILGGLQWVLASPSIRSASADAPPTAPGTRYVGGAPAISPNATTPAATVGSNRTSGAANVTRVGVPDAVLGKAGAAASLRPSTMAVGTGSALVALSLAGLFVLQ